MVDLLATTASPWLTLAVAVIGGGAVGSALTTFWRVRHERAEAWRARLLDAADDFVTGGLQALKLEANGEWFWLSHMGHNDGLSSPEANAMRTADTLIDEARARLARIHLLYGTASVTGANATQLVGALRDMSKAFWGDPEGGGIQWNEADQALKGARASLDVFSAAARRSAWRGRAEFSAADDQRAPPWRNASRLNSWRSE
jgi:hypothetical protein